MYIRTKDEILKVLETEYMCGVKIYHTNKGMISEKQVLKEADSIAELCDEFHIEFDSLLFPKEINYVKYYDFEIAKNNLEDGDTLYGVIHIKGKGLIYVAKMNENGELELI